jgi:hypothetical protein
LKAAIRGDGSAIPVVKVANWTDLQDVGTATTGDIKKFRGPIKSSLEGIDMAKLERHVGGQIKQAAKGNATQLWKIAPEVMLDTVVNGNTQATANAVAAKDPKAAFEASMKQLGHSDEQIEILWQQVSKGPKKA